MLVWMAALETENIYRIYAESFRGADHLLRILEEAQTIVSDASAATATDRGKGSASSAVSESREEGRSEGKPNCAFKDSFQKIWRRKP
jgi:phosphoglucomutase